MLNIAKKVSSAQAIRRPPSSSKPPPDVGVFRNLYLNLSLRPPAEIAVQVALSRILPAQITSVL